MKISDAECIIQTARMKNQYYFAEKRILFVEFILISGDIKN